MKLYIKIDENGDIASYPITEDNLNYFFGVGVQWDDEMALAQGFAAIKNHTEPPLEEYTEVIKGEIVKNAQGEIEQLWTVTEISRDEKIRRWILGPREYYLISCDWTQLPDAPISDEMKEKWKIYRQTLRDITDVTDFSTVKSRIDVPWPDMPSLPSKDTKYGAASIPQPRLSAIELIVPTPTEPT